MNTNNIKIINNTNFKVTINPSEDGRSAILIVDEEVKKRNATPLGKIARGSTVKIGGRDYVVLDHSAETTSIIAKEFVKSMEFDSNSADYAASTVRKYLNGPFYEELVKAVGKNNIITHTVDLMADDGTGRGKRCRDNVSLLTTEKYRRYRPYLPKMGDGNWWCTATRASYEDGYARCVCYVGGDGALGWNGCGYGGGVRPFCVLDSSITNFELSES